MMQKRRAYGAGIYTRLLMAVLFLSMAGAASASDLDRVVDGLQRKYDSIAALSADFSQEFTSRAIGTKAASNGRVYFKKPGRMRWIYSSPTRDEVASDGRTIWIYQPDLNQVMEKSVDAATSSIATDFLSGVGKIREQFDISLAEEGRGPYRLSLVPKAGNLNIVRIVVEVDRKTYLVASTAVEDGFGNLTVVRFTNIKPGESRPDSFFEFRPPKGATVVRP